MSKGFFSILVVMAVAFGFAGCNSKHMGDSGSGAEDMVGSCVKECSIASDCCPPGIPNCPSAFPANYTCENGVCGRTQCQTQDDCGGAGSPLDCLESGGRKDCYLLCTTDVECGPYSKCTGVAGNKNFCVSDPGIPCVDDAQCKGYGVCKEGVCLCTSDAECTANGVDKCVAQASSHGESGNDGGTKSCVYPTGPYGNLEGDVVNPNLKWPGYADGTTTPNQLTDIAITDYYDCDGSKGINALALFQAAAWESQSDQLARELNERMANGWTAMGVRVLTLMIEDLMDVPATSTTAFRWKTDPSHNLVSSAVAADPNFSFQTTPVTALPLLVLVDPRTMRIVSTQMGTTDSYPAIDSLAYKNMGP